MPRGNRLENIKKSPNYRNGAFQNLSETPDLTEGANYFTVTKDLFCNKDKRLAPAGILPSVKTDLKMLPPDENVLVWFGHSSYFMQIDGKRMLVDPVFSGNASPVSFTTKAFAGTDIYTADDMPMIDYLFISHDHYDHLDHQTMIKLQSKIKKVFCGLGTGEHLEYWGFDADLIVERDWNDSIKADDGFNVHLVPARHFSGRGFKRNQALWTSFVLQTAHMNIFIGGDSGYDAHFADIGKKFGPFDLAIIENGQYNKSWKHIHLMPHEVLMAAKDLKALKILPVHSCKFALGLHAWDEPLELISKHNLTEQLHIITPMIGEIVKLGDVKQTFKSWWKEVL
jgi:L-ascorbate metabolism protein UlaG (beta-lactamase superfamily)